MNGIVSILPTKRFLIFGKISSEISLEFDRPVSMVEELLPALIPFVAEMDMSQWIVFWFDGNFDKSHVCLFGRHI